MSKVLAVVVTYFPEEDQLMKNLGSFIDEVDRIIIWENTPGDQAAAYRFIQNPKIQYMGVGTNVGIAKALNLVLSYAMDKGYDYLMTMDQDSDWENFAWYKSVIVDNFHAPEALFCPIREVQSIEAQRINKANESETLTISIPAIPESYPQFVDNSTENQELKTFEVSDCKENQSRTAHLVPTMNLITSGMLAKTSLLNRLGGYCKDLFVDGIDEELVCRAKVQGVPSYFVEGAIFHHQLGYPIRKRFFGKSYTVPGYSQARLYDRYRSLYILMEKYSESKYPSSSYPDLAAVRARLQYDWLKTAPIRILLGADHRFSKLWNIWKGWRDGKKWASSQNA